MRLPYRNASRELEGTDLPRCADGAHTLQVQCFCLNPLHAKPGYVPLSPFLNVRSACVSSSL